MPLQARFKKDIPTTIAPKHVPGVHREKHYTAPELAKLWGLSADTIRKLFRNEDGVLKVPSLANKDGQRPYNTLTIPESIAAKVHQRLHGKVAA